MAAKKHKVLWEDSGLSFDNVPFVVVNHWNFSLGWNSPCNKALNQLEPFHFRWFNSLLLRDCRVISWHCTCAQPSAKRRFVSFVEQNKKLIHYSTILSFSSIWPSTFWNIASSENRTHCIRCVQMTKIKYDSIRAHILRVQALDLISGNNKITYLLNDWINNVGACINICSAVQIKLKLNAKFSYSRPIKIR